MSKREGTGRRYRRLVAHQRSLGLPCWICGKAIRYDLPGGHPLSYEYDHYYPASRWREFGYPTQAACVNDPGNGRSAHRVCNERRQGAMPWEKRFKRLVGNRKQPPAPPAKSSRAN